MLNNLWPIVSTEQFDSTFKKLTRDAVWEHISGDDEVHVHLRDGRTVIMFYGQRKTTLILKDKFGNEVFGMNKRIK